jgi:acyl carrier protein
VTEAEILARLQSLLQDILDDPSVRLGPATRRSDVGGWDSFKYVTFIVAVEADLGIRFSVADVESFATVGDIVAEVRRLLG